MFGIRPYVAKTTPTSRIDPHAVAIEIPRTPNREMNDVAYRWDLQFCSSRLEGFDPLCQYIGTSESEISNNDRLEK